MAVDGSALKKQASQDVKTLMAGVEDGDVDAMDVEKVVRGLLDVLIPSGPLEGVEDALINGAFNAVKGLVRKARSGGGRKDRLLKRAEKLRAKADKLEKKAAGM